jgi:hypothetical protein
MAGPGEYPTLVVPFGSGQRGLAAASDLPAGSLVARFEGPVVPWREVPADEARHALLLDGDRWLLPRNEARFINHSCAPDCRLAADLGVVTTRAVAAGEALTIRYDSLTMAEYLRAPDAFFWDERWSFDCQCGAPDCVGRVDRYRIRRYEGAERVTPATKLRLGTSQGRGRGVFATAAIARDEVFERAPVIVSDASEWSHIEPTSLFHYCFAWGPRLEHTAIGLGYASLYNHSYAPNAVYLRQLDELLIHFVALRDIAAGEELTVNYNDDPGNQKPLWFEVK